MMLFSAWRPQRYPTCLELGSRIGLCIGLGLGLRIGLGLVSISHLFLPINAILQDLDATPVMTAWSVKISRYHRDFKTWRMFEIVQDCSRKTGVKPWWSAAASIKVSHLSRPTEPEASSHLYKEHVRLGLGLRLRFRLRLGLRLWFRLRLGLGTGL